MHEKIVVLGAGPGGYAAAFLAADLGLSVTLIDADSQLGGVCLQRGCIPSKALLHVARTMTEARELADWGVTYQTPTIDIDAVRAKKEKVVATLSGGLAQLAKRRNVTVLHARASFVDSGTLRLEPTPGETLDDNTITFEHCILATGSSPTSIPSLTLPTSRVMNSTGALALTDVPASLLVVGGGYIGLEMGTVYHALGSRVSVVEMTEGLLPGADRNLVKPLQKRLETQFESIRLSTKVVGMEDRGESIAVTFETNSQQETLEFDRVLVSIGRTPNTAGLGLENTQVKVDQRGFVEIDSQQRTDDPKILAVGDITGNPMLAHKAAAEGRIVAEVLAGRSVQFQPRAIPAVVFTDPEIAWAGLTETEAKAQERPIAVAQFPWAASGRAQAVGRTEGTTKWIIDPDTERILGCGIVGPGAGDLIGEAVLAIESETKIGDVAKAIHPHPTLTETLGAAAEVYFGTATDLYRPKRSR